MRQDRQTLSPKYKRTHNTVRSNNSCFSFSSWVSKANLYLHCWSCRGSAVTDRNGRFEPYCLLADTYRSQPVVRCPTCCHRGGSAHSERRCSGAALQSRIERRMQNIISDSIASPISEGIIRCIHAVPSSDWTRSTAVQKLCFTQTPVSCCRCSGVAADYRCLELQIATCILPVGLKR